MNKTWDLDPIYQDFSDPAFGQDMQKLEQAVACFADFTRELKDTTPRLAALRRGIVELEQIAALVDKLATYTNLRQAADTKNPEAGSQMGRILSVYSGVAAPQAAFETWASSLPELMETVEADSVLKDYRFLFANMKENSCHLLPGMGEEIMARMAISGSGAWGDLQGYVTSTVPVEYRGQKLNLSAVRNLAYDPDPQVRRDAFQAELACYPQIQAPVAFALNSIKMETLTDCQLRGYSSPLERTLKQSHMSQKTLDAMFRAMQQYLPKFHQYLRRKAKVLGHPGGLPWYDLFAPVGAASAKVTVEQAKEYLLQVFSGFDGEMAQMIDRAFTEAWIDFYPRDGKTGGAFCAAVPCIGQSRVLANFDGAFTDIITLAHELGHAFHNLCIRQQSPLNQEYSLPLAETASTFNECAVMAAAIRDAKDEKLALIESQLQDSTQIICDIYSRYLFEAEVFRCRPESFMDADTLCEMMIRAQKAAYGDGLEEGCMHPYMWVCKSHYYGPTFYNFPYAFGGLFARGLYARYEQEGAAFVPKYKELLQKTTVACAEDVAKVAGIDLTDENFWKAGLQMIADQIDLFCELTEEM